MPAVSQAPAVGLSRPRPIAVLRGQVVALLVLLAGAPFLLTPLPPLTDVPGHIGRFFVQTAPAGDGVLRYFGFHRAVTLNLASDLLVQLLHPLFGVVPTVWMLCVATAMLSVVGIVAVARVLNPRGAHALPWALLFVFNFPFLWGFLNFALTAALALIAFAAWVRLRERTGMRAAIFLIAVPLLLVGHGVAGIVAVAAIVGHGAGEAAGTERWSRTALAPLVATWPPVLATIVALGAWKLAAMGDGAGGGAGGGPTLWLAHRKVEAIVMALRDQHIVLDTGSMLACAVVWVFGQRRGARLRGGARGAVACVGLLFLATPSLISGSDRIDTRLAPVVAMLAFAAQDWSAVDRRSRRAVLLAGFALLTARHATTAWSFAGYDRRYRMELAALDQVPRGARVLNLVTVDCPPGGWRSERLEHLGAMVTALRGGWVNAHWSIAGLQLLDVKYRPSADYSTDPSQLIWPARCVDATIRFKDRDRHMLVESMPQLPLARVDYLWLIDATLPAGYHDARLRRVWHDDISELYAVKR